MTRFSRATAVLAPAVLSLSMLTAGVVAGAAPDESVARLIDISGTGEALARMSASTIAEFESAVGAHRVPGGLDVADMQALTTLLGDLYGTTRLRAGVVQRVAAALPVDDTSSLLDFYESAFGRRIVRAGLEHDLHADPAGFQRFLVELEHDPDRDARLAFGQRVESLLETGTWATALAIETEVAIVAGLSVHHRESIPEGPEAYRTRLRAEREPLTGQLRQMMTLFHAWCFEDFDTDSLDLAYEHIATPAALAFYGATIGGMTDSIVQGAETLGEELGRRLADAVVHQDL